MMPVPVPWSVSYVIVTMVVVILINTSQRADVNTKVALSLLAGILMLRHGVNLMRTASA